MLFSSYEFIFVFLPITLFIFFKIGRQNQNLKIASLVVASLIFYGWWNYSYLSLLLISMGFNYLIGVILCQRSWLIKLPFGRKILLIFGIGINLGLLAYFKYAHFILNTANKLSVTSFHLQTIILPLAISFFTFTQIAYLVDNYRQEAREYSFLKYCLFITFFPHLIAGPIVHHKEIIPQFDNKSVYLFNAEDVAVGLTIFCFGLSKKVLLADGIATYANPVFDAAARGIPLTFVEAWFGAIAYSLQLYFDFSGYSDMAIGAARMFGIKFPLNFNSPYKSVSIIEFWRRWHITLSNFLRDYLYIPLGGNRQGKLRRHINVMITMLLGGLWHGAGWNFIIWGGLHGVYLVINYQWLSLQRSLGHDSSKSHWLERGLACLATFVAVVVAWVFFRASNVGTAIAMLRGMIGANGISLSEVMSATHLPWLKVARGISFLLIIVWFTPNTQEWMERYNPVLDRVVTSSSNWRERFWKNLQWQPNKVWSICTALVFSLAIIELVRPTEFLYFHF